MYPGILISLNRSEADETELVGVGADSYRFDRVGGGGERRKPHRHILTEQGALNHFQYSGHLGGGGLVVKPTFA
jgi:hypothetical protein